MSTSSIMDSVWREDKPMFVEKIENFPLSFYCKWNLNSKCIRAVALRRNRQNSLVTKAKSVKTRRVNVALNQMQAGTARHLAGSSTITLLPMALDNSPIRLEKHSTIYNN